jgi:outer membrane protein, multidrug efflux system
MRCWTLLIPLAVELVGADLHAATMHRSASEIPAAPSIDPDPLLASVPPAPHLVPSWNDAVSLLRSRSTDLRVALDDIVRAEAGFRAALSGTLPTLTGSANVTANLIRSESSCGPGCSTTLPDLLLGTAGLSLVQPVFAPRAWHAVRSAKVSIENAAIALDEQKRQLSIALANAIVGVVTAERVSEVNRIGLRAALERLALTRRRATLGASNALDVVRAEQDIATARATVVSGDESLRQARETLGLALGSPEPWGVAPDISLDGLPAAAGAWCESIPRLENRTDILAARGRVELSRRSIQDARLQFSPTLNLVSSLTASSYDQANRLHQGWTIAGVLTIPILDGGAHSSAVREARAVYDQAVQHSEATHRSASVQLAQARRAIGVAEQSRQVAEQARNLARETERLARIAFQAGTATSLDLVESGRTLRVAEVQLAIQEFQLVQARLASLLALSHCRW